MIAEESQFEAGRIDNYKRDFYKTGYARDDDRAIFIHPRSKKFEYTDSTETSENSDGSIFKIPLSQVSLESLKIIPAETYIIVQSSEKTIFIRLGHKIKPGEISTNIKGNMLIIGVKK